VVREGEGIPLELNEREKEIALERAEPAANGYRLFEVGIRFPA
jgi:hypothetical protein